MERKQQEVLIGKNIYPLTISLMNHLAHTIKNMDDAYRSTLLPPTTGNLQVASRPRPSRWPRQSALRSIVRKQINGHYTGHCCALVFVNLPINLEAGWFTNGECPSQKTTREHLLAPMMNELESNSQMIFILICTTGRLMESPNLSSTVVQKQIRNQFSKSHQKFRGSKIKNEGQQLGQTWHGWPRLPKRPAKGC